MTITLRHGQFRTRLRFRFSHAAAERTATENIIVEIQGSDGICGYGEGCPRPYVTGENTQTAQHFITAHGQEIAAMARTVDDLRGWITDNETLIDTNPAAFAAIELAILDRLGKRANQPLEVTIGAPYLSGPLPYTAVIGDSKPLVTRLVGTAHRLWGFSDFKIKLNGDKTRDLKRLRTLPARARIRADANNHWPNASACIDHIRSLGNPFWAIEEPVTAGDFTAMRTIATSLDIRIVLDESLTRRSHLQPCSQDPHFWVANIRVSKCGGILRASQLAREAQALGIEIILGAHVGETSLLTRAALAVGQSLQKPPLAREGAYGRILLADDLAQPPLQFSRGGSFHPARHGLQTAAGSGVTVTPQNIEWPL